MDLLDLIREQEHAEDPRSTWVHSVLPNMGYACGGDMVRGLPDGGPKGKWKLGGWGREWPNITCPDCRSWGRRGLARRAHRQQMEPGHECPPPPADGVLDPENNMCHRWQSVDGEDNT